MTIDWTKPILWDGLPARVLATDMTDIMYHPVLIRNHDGYQETCTIYGCVHGDQRVTNAPERVERWANMGDPRFELMLHCSKRDADKYRGNGCTTTLCLIWEDNKLVSADVVPLEGE